MHPLIVQNGNVVFVLIPLRNAESNEMKWKLISTAARTQEEEKEVESENLRK